MARPKKGKQAKKPTRSPRRAKRQGASRVAHLRRNLTSLARAIDKLPTSFSKLAGPDAEVLVTPPNSDVAFAFCDQDWACYGAKAEAKNIQVTILSRDTIKVGLPNLASDDLVKKSAEETVKKQVEKLSCSKDCAQDCRCVGFTFNLKLHDRETRVVYLDRLGKPALVQAARAYRIKLTVEFDIALTINCGVCLEA